MIVELELPPGDRLVESELAAAFGVSKTPVRESLLRLEAEGLVALQPYQGATVTWLSFPEFEELIFIQDALELTALPLVVDRITDKQLAEVRRHLDRAVRSRAEGDSRRCFEAGQEVHRLLFGPLGFGRVDRILYDMLLRPTRRYVRALVHPTAEGWDAEIRILTSRFEHVARRDAQGAIDAVRDGRARMLEIAYRQARTPAGLRLFGPNATDERSAVRPGRASKARVIASTTIV
jgi:DNA-binding GntR family transcriptional regulator